MHIFDSWVSKCRIALKFGFVITNYQVFDCKKRLWKYALEVMLATWYLHRIFLSIGTPKYLAWSIFSRHFVGFIIKSNSSFYLLMWEPWIVWNFLEIFFWIDYLVDVCVICKRANWRWNCKKQIVNVHQK